MVFASFKPDSVSSLS